MNLVTVDVEDWFHVCGVEGPLSERYWDALPSRVVQTTRRLLEDFDHAGVQATFFIVGWVAERFPGLIAEIAAAGHEIGAHGHRHRRLYELTAASFAADLRANRAALAAAGVASVRAFRAPEWSLNERAPWALDVLAAAGFTIDASRAPLKLVGDVGYPRTPHVLRTGHGDLLEVPPFVADRFGQTMPMGWGWGLRMSSPARVLRAMAAANRRGTPAVLTIHPWEIDPDPPRVRLSPRLRFAHYFCLAGFDARLRQVLSGATFTTLGALEHAARSAAPPCMPAA